MRIAVITNRYVPRIGGVELHTYHLAQSLADRGHEVEVITIAEDPGRRRDGEVEVLTGRAHLPVADVITFPALGTTTQLAAHLARRRIDVVSVHTRFFPMSMVGLRAAHRAGIPVIHTEHGSNFVAADSPVVSLGSRAVDLTMGRYVVTHADRVLGVSPAAAAFARRLGAREAEVFYNAITPPDRSVAVTDRPGRLVFVGRLVPGKGWDTYLQALARLRSQGLEVTGELIGDGPDREAARQMAQELGVDGQVELAGRLSPQEVRTHLRGATLLNPTVLSEGFQTSLLEVVAERGRVVTFPVPGAEELRTDGQPVLVTAGTSLDELVTTTSAMVSSPLPLAAPERIDRWTWPARATQFESIAARTYEAFHQGQTH